MQIKVAVIDDDFSALQAIKNYCDELKLDVIAAHQSPNEFLEKLNSYNINLAILDYEMPQLNGMQLADILSSKNIPVIFITGHRDQFGAKAWDTNCIDCIEKPLSIEKLRKAICKLQPGLSVQEKEVYNFKIYGDKFAPIPFNDIALITTCNTDNSHKYKYLQTFSGLSYKIYKMDMEELLQILPRQAFARISKSEIISRKAIRHFNSAYDLVELNIKPIKNECDVFPKSDKIELSIGDSYRAQVKTWLSL